MIKPLSDKQKELIHTILIYATIGGVGMLAGTKITYEACTNAMATSNEMWLNYSGNTITSMANIYTNSTKETSKALMCICADKIRREANMTPLWHNGTEMCPEGFTP